MLHIENSNGRFPHSSCFKILFFKGSITEQLSFDHSKAKHKLSKAFLETLIPLMRTNVAFPDEI